jgi:hypothetical protein
LNEIDVIILRAYVESLLCASLCHYVVALQNFAQPWLPVVCSSGTINSTSTATARTTGCLYYLLSSTIMLATMIVLSCYLVICNLLRRIYS